jgi:hypothetical protein
MPKEIATPTTPQRKTAQQHPEITAFISRSSETSMTPVNLPLIHGGFFRLDLQSAPRWRRSQHRRWSCDAQRVLTEERALYIGAKTSRVHSQHEHRGTIAACGR